MRLYHTKIPLLYFYFLILINIKPSYIIELTNYAVNVVIVITQYFSSLTSKEKVSNHGIQVKHEVKMGNVCMCF